MSKEISNDISDARIEEVRDKLNEIIEHPLIKIRNYIEMEFDLSAEEVEPEFSELIEAGVEFSVDWGRKVLIIWVSADDYDVQVLPEERESGVALI